MSRPGSDSPLVTVIIPTYKRTQKLFRLLDSILASDYKNIEIVIVRDSSPDDKEKSPASFPGARLIESTEQLLLAGSRNVGIRNSSGDLIFFVDDDNIVAKDALSQLVSAMKANAQVGVAGPMMYYLEDPTRVWCGRVKRNFLSSRTTFPERGMRNVAGRPSESDEFPNAFMTRRSFIENVGLFDTHNFPIHYDEADFCKRMRDNGYQVLLVPTSKVWHDISLPRGRAGRARRYSVHTVRRAFYAARNRILFHRKYSTSRQFAVFLVLFLPIVTFAYLNVISTDTDLNLKQRITIVKAYLTGTFEGLSKGVATR